MNGLLELLCYLSGLVALARMPRAINDFRFVDFRNEFKLINRKSILMNFMKQTEIKWRGNLTGNLLSLMKAG